MAERKLDLFRLLDQITVKRVDYYNTLEDDEKKEFQPFVIMRWLTGTYNRLQVTLLNETVNKFAFNISQHHKQLMYNLMIACTSGKSQRYIWNKAPGSGRKGKLTLEVVCQYFGYGIREGVQAVDLLSPDQIIEYAEELGWQKDEIAKLKKELKKDAKE